MRFALAFVVVLVPLVCSAAADGRATGFVNHTVSARSIALNEPVRVEFITMGRQVDGVDPAMAVRSALGLGAVTRSWRMVGSPTVSEHEKTRTLTITFAVQPRETGELPLPQVPLTWLTGGQVADFGTVTVQQRVRVGTESREMPKEALGVAEWRWGATLQSVQATLPPDTSVESAGPVTRIAARPGLTLGFRGGELAEADIVAAGLDLPQARESFLGRWGAPESETPEAIRWVIGWTAITASQGPAPGTVPGAQPRTAVLLHLAREDIQARIDQGRVQDQVFNVLDGSAQPPPYDPKVEMERRRAEAQAELNRPRLTPPKE